MLKKVFALSLIMLFINSFKIKAFAENADVNLDSYIKNLQTIVKENWIPPYLKSDAQVVVQLRIEKSGAISQCQILQSSGDKFIDESFLDVIKKINTYMPLPTEFNSDSIDIKLTSECCFVYDDFSYTSTIYVKALNSNGAYQKLSGENKKIYNKYSKDVKIILQKNPPVEHSKEHKIVKLRITAQADGDIKEIKIIEGSEDPLYDKTIKDEIKKIKLPNIPDELGIKELEFEYFINNEIIGSHPWTSP